MRFLSNATTATISWTEAVQANIREGRKMGFHHRPIEPNDLALRQFETTQNHLNVDRYPSRSMGHAGVG